MRSRLGRVFRAIDARLILALVALIVAATICWGFVQRGQHITEAEKSVTDLSGQVGDLIKENRRLHSQLQHSEQVAARRAREAARERDVLQRELLRLVNFLRESGIDVPLTGARLEAPAVTSGAAEATRTPDQEARSGGPATASHGGGTAPGSSHGHSHGQSHGDGGPSAGHGHRGGMSVDVGPAHLYVQPPALRP